MSLEDHPTRKIRDLIKKVEQENNLNLSTTQKILLSIEGPIVTILDVLYGEVKLFFLEQHIKKAVMIHKKQIVMD